MCKSPVVGTFRPRRAFGVTYGPVDDLPFADVDAWEDFGLPVVSPRAYPLAADLASDGYGATPGALAWLRMMDIARHGRMRKRSRTH